jgi:cytochrome subunit of sulfide dehydrogenase
MFKRLLSGAVVLVSLAGGVTQLRAAEAPPQVEVCAACHGVSAPSPYPSVPTIHGLPEVVLDNAMYDFRATIRPCRKVDCGGAADCPQIDFCAIIALLSDEQIAALARWYSSQPYAPAGEPWDPAEASRGHALHVARCESCHAGGGRISVDQASILRGQPKGYLRTAMEDFRAERRVAVAEMHVRLTEFSEEELTSLVEFYASPAD